MAQESVSAAQNNGKEIETIYHYCSMETFVKIIENKCLWLTDIKKMNDREEGKWILSRYKHVLRDMISEFGPMASFMCEEVVFNVLRHMCCFSAENDILSQWRAYAQDGTGIAIGFDIAKLGFSGESTESDCLYPHIVNEDISLIRTLYSLEEHELLCKELKDTVEERRSEWTVDKDKFQFIVYDEMLAASCYLKNPAFIEEKEYRIVVINPIGNKEKFENIKDEKFSYLDGVSFRTNVGGLSSYSILRFPVEAVTCLSLGPQNRTDYKDLYYFLEAYGYPRPKMMRSTATYMSNS